MKTAIADAEIRNGYESSACRRDIGKRIGAGSYRADKGKQLVFPFPLFQLQHLNNCNMRKRKPKEEWADVPGYEGLYRVSSFGRVIADPRTREYTDKDGNVKVRYYERRFIEPKQDRNKYKCVTLRDRDENMKVWSIHIHRLVALAFIPNPDNLPIVNHKDENKSNNHADNLEWCTHQYNITYGTAIERRSASLRVTCKEKAQARADAEAIEREAKIERRIKRRGMIMVWEAESGREIGEYRTVEDAIAALGITVKQPALIEQCLEDKRDSAYGYQWYYVKDFMNHRLYWN